MEFPAPSWDFFPSEDFELAAPRFAGRLGAEIMAQARPNGRVMDHWRVALGGSEILLASTDLTKIIPAASSLPKWRLSYNMWPRDIVIRRNMACSEWTDVLSLIERNDVIIDDNMGEPVLNTLVLGELKKIKSKEPVSASFRWAVVIGCDHSMELQLQSLPASASFLAGRPVFKRYKNNYISSDHTNQSDSPS
jgi:hypothetical protein